jgi:hypothetical protein
VARAMQSFGHPRSRPGLAGVQAVEGTKVLDADASFRYGCARRSGTLP